MNKVIFGDCRDVMRKLIADGVKVQMCVTSPPYWQLRDYGHPGQLGLEDSIDEYLANQVEVFRLVWDLLADDGTLWVNMGDSYANGGRTSRDQGRSKKHPSYKRDHAKPTRRQDPPGISAKNLIGQPWRLAFALQDAGWILRQDIIWHKLNPMPESVSDRFTKAHEYIFMLTKQKRYYFDQQAVKEPASKNTHARRRDYGVGFGHGDDKEQRGRDRQKKRIPSGWDTSDGNHRDKTGRYDNRKLADKDAGRDEQNLKTSDRFGRGPGWRTKNNSSFDDAMSEMPEMRNKRSVWSTVSEPFSGAHFATFPTALIEPCILAGSRPGDIVLDPYFGSGTTGQVAQDLGRQWIGVEINEEYSDLQKQRTAQFGFEL